VSRVASQRKRSALRASSGSASLGPLSPEYASVVPFCETRKPNASMLVVEDAARRHCRARRGERRAVGVLLDPERGLEHVALAEVLEVPLLTTDERLARSHGHHAEIIVPLRMNVALLTTSFED